MRRCSSILMLAPALALLDPAGAQTLDLDGWGAAPAPPSLGFGSYAADLSRRLQQEMKDIAAAAEGAPPTAQVVALASIKLRDLAVRLLDQGDEAGQTGSATVLAGVRLVRGREAVDTLLGRAETDNVPAALAALRRYVDPGRTWSTQPDPNDPAALDAALADHLQPLAEAVRMLVPGETANHWITTAEVGQDAAAAAEQALAAVLGRLQGSAAASALDGDAGDALAETMQFLQRGASFEEFRPQVREYARLLADALMLSADVQAAAWLSDDQRAACRAIVADAIVQFAGMETREQGVARLGRIAGARALIGRITALYEHAADGPRPDMTPVVSAFGAVVTATDDDDPPQVDRLAAILDRMIAYRELRTPALTRELRHAWRKLNDGYERTERGIVDALPQLTTEPGALADPALASLVADHRQYLDDLQRLQSLPQWLEMIRHAAPRAAGPFGGRLRKTVGDLGDPGSRQDAVRELDRLDRQMRSYFPLPFEQQLIDGDRAAIIATGGLNEQLAGEIERQRRVWADAWGAGGDGDAAARMDTLVRLMRITADAAPVLAAGDDATVLDRWAAWELDPQTMQRIGTELRNRLRLATTAAIGGDDGGLADQVARIRAPQTALVSALLTRLRTPLDGLPSGPLSIVGQFAETPGPDAWMLAHRAEIADLCRYTMEMEYARSTGREQLAGDLDDWLDGVAATLMKEIAP